MSNIKCVAAVLGAMTLAAPVVNAADNPFQVIEFGQATVVATDARDMKGNAVKIDDQTGFTYGGDNTGAYGGNKVGTGKKDPKVCGTFGNATCSIKYVEK
jgi:hypothetical protein